MLCKKILKFVVKEYMAPPSKKIKSLIKYFTVLKGIIKEVVQDWGIVFHAGANKLNNSVWAPLFSLPTVNTLLRTMDMGMLIEDRDI